MIEFKNVEKTFQTPTGILHALKNINLKTAPGAICGVIGRSGAGKSTLIRCANLLERPSAGQVFVDNEELTALSPAELRITRRRIGMIFQHFNLLATRTVYENIAFPLELTGASKMQIKAAVMPLLELTNLVDKKDVYPAALSGGQKQRVAIARALAPKPKTLLCDEATSALDPETTKNILALLKNINQQFGLTILLITHEMEVIKEICDDVALLDQGEIIEQNSIINFFTQPKTALGAQVVKACLKHELPARLQVLLQDSPHTSNNPVLRIIFHGHAAAEPLVAQLMEQFHIRLNILQANIEFLKNNTLGIMVAELADAHNNLEKSLAYLRQKDVTAEVIGYVERTLI